MNVVPYLRKQSAVHSRLERLVRDTANALWSDLEVYESLNQALDEWSNKVVVPRYYEQTWTAGTYEYTLPDYITSFTDPYIKRTVWGIDLDTGSVSQLLWKNQISHFTHPDSSGGQSLIVDVTVPSVTGKIIWWMNNGPVPTTIPTTSGSVTAAATSLTISSAPDIGRAGYVYIDSEWIAYAGIDVYSGSVTLNNLIRGINDTTAGTHAASSNVEWGIASFRTDLYQQLSDQTMVHLHEYFLTGDASPTEKGHHERMLGYYQDRADAFWRRFTPLHQPKMVLSREAMGELPNDNYWAFNKEYEW